MAIKFPSGGTLRDHRGGGGSTSSFHSYTTNTQHTSTHSPAPTTSTDASYWPGNFQFGRWSTPHSPQPSISSSPDASTHGPPAIINHPLHTPHKPAAPYSPNTVLSPFFRAAYSVGSALSSFPSFTRSSTPPESNHTSIHLHHHSSAPTHHRISSSGAFHQPLGGSRTSSLDSRPVQHRRSSSSGGGSAAAGSRRASPGMLAIFAMSALLSVLCLLGGIDILHRHNGDLTGGAGRSIRAAGPFNWMHTSAMHIKGVEASHVTDKTVRKHPNLLQQMAAAGSRVQHKIAILGYKDPQDILPLPVMRLSKIEVADEQAAAGAAAAVQPSQTADAQLDERVIATEGAEPMSIRDTSQLLAPQASTTLPRARVWSDILSIASVRRRSRRHL